MKRKSGPSRVKIKILFFLLLIPTIMIGEFIRFLHNVRPYTLPNSVNPSKVGFIRTSDRKKILVNYTDNTDRVIIVIHGYLSSSKRSFMKYGKFFSNNGYDIIAVDLRNHGLSELSLPISAGYKERLDVIATLKWAKTKWSKVHIIGTSMGAYAIIYALADLSRTQIIPNSVILESFGIDLKIGTRDTFIELYKFPTTLAAMITTYISIRMPVLIQRDIIQDIVSIEDKIHVLIAHGSKDQIYPADVIQGILANKLNRTVKFTIIENAKHSELWNDEGFLHRMINVTNAN